MAGATTPLAATSRSIMPGASHAAVSCSRADATACEGRLDSSGGLMTCSRPGASACSSGGWASACCSCWWCCCWASEAGRPVAYACAPSGLGAPVAAARRAESTATGRLLLVVVRLFLSRRRPDAMDARHLRTQTAKGWGNMRGLHASLTTKLTEQPLHLTHHHRRLYARAEATTIMQIFAHAHTVHTRRVPHILISSSPWPVCQRLQTARISYFVDSAAHIQVRRRGRSNT